MRRLRHRSGSSSRRPAPGGTAGGACAGRSGPAITSGQRGWNGQPTGPRAGMRHRAADGRQPLRAASPGCSAPSAAARGYRDAGAPRTAAATGAELDDAAEIHHRDIIGHLRDHAHVVGDQHQRDALLRCSRRSSARICAWVVTSSAVVGSSAIRMSRVGRPAPWRCRRAGAGRRSAGTDRRRSAAPDAGCRPRAAARSPARAPRPWRWPLCARTASMIWLPTV